MSIGVLVFTYRIVQITVGLINHTPPTSMEFVLWIDDLVVGSPMLLVGGYLLLRRKALGYVAGREGQDDLGCGHAAYSRAPGGARGGSDPITVHCEAT